MATGRFHTGSHNFEWCAIIQDNQMTAVTLQTKCDPTLPYVHPKVAWPLEISSGSKFIQTWPAASRWYWSDRSGHQHFVYRDVIAGSHESRDSDAPIIYRIQKSLLHQNNTFFIATTRVVKDATDWKVLEEQWYYLRFYVGRTMPPTALLSRDLCTVPGRAGRNKKLLAIDQSYNGSYPQFSKVTFSFHFRFQTPTAVQLIDSMFLFVLY